MLAAGSSVCCGLFTHAAEHRRHIAQSSSVYLCPRWQTGSLASTARAELKPLRLCRPWKAQSRSTCSCTAETGVQLEASAPEPATQPEPEPSTSADSRSTVPTADTWELDFCSRPMLDERGKKVWELLICDSKRAFEYAQYFPNNKINSTQLKNALEEILQQPGAVKPERVRFFRGQMQTIITRALKDLEIKPLPSRRCFALTGWLEQRLEEVYKKEERYDAKASSAFMLDLGPPEELPDALRGERWEFVQLPLGELLQEMRQVQKAEVFGEGLSLETAGLQGLAPEAAVPGLAVFSRRAVPLAAWTSGVELAAVKADTERAALILETGVNQRFRYGRYLRTPTSTAEAKAWEESKQSIGGLHFLVVQEDEESETVAGIWLLLDREPPAV